MLRIVQLVLVLLSIVGRNMLETLLTRLIEGLFFLIFTFLFII